MAIRKTVAGTFEVDFRDQYKRRIQRTFATHRDAVAFHKEALAQVARQEYIKPSSDTIGEIARDWHANKVEAGTYKRSSLSAWENHVGNFIVADLGNLKIGQVDVEIVERAAAKWSERTSPVTANKVLTTLAAVMDRAKRHKKIKDNAAREAERLKLQTQDEDANEVTPDQVYSREEIGKLIAATEPGSVDRSFLMILSLLGPRIGEALALTWPAIDLKAGKLRVLLTMADSDKGQEPLFQAPKTKHSRRTLDLPQELVRELKIWKLKCPPSERDLVFATEEGKPFHRKSAGKMLDRAVAKAGLGKRLTPHGLRHTFASLLLAAGVPVPEVSHLLGHKNSSVTMSVYAHFVREETRSVHNLAASILT
jgi:integrase